MTKSASIVLRLLCAAVALSFTGCLTKRTVTEGGQVVSQNFYVKRPVRDAMKSENQSSSR